MGQVKWAKVAQELSIYNVTHNNMKSKTKFFYCKLQDLPNVFSMYLNSSFMSLELCLHKNIFVVPSGEPQVINTLRAGLIQAVRKKQVFRTWLCG